MEELKIILCIALVVPSQSEKFNGTQIVETLGSQLCPYSNYCHTSAASDIRNQTHVPCCLPCSCDDDCWIEDNCCPDKVSEEHEKPALKCKLSMTKISSLHTNDQYRNDLFKRFRVVDYCPGPDTESDLVQKCSGENAPDLESYRWVSDETTGFIYQNRFCAKCNGVSDYVQWEIIVTHCKDIFENPSQFNDVIMLDTCSIVNAVPDKLKDTTDRFRCYLPQYSTCNMTGQWEVYDSQIDTACSVYTAYFFLVRVKLVIYKNAFCYACNTGSIESINTICPIEAINEMDRVNYLALTVLIDGAVLEAYKTPETVDRKCETDEVYDVFMVRIHRLFAYCKGGNFNTHIWAWFGYFIC